MDEDFLTERSRAAFMSVELGDTEVSRPAIWYFYYISSRYVVTCEGTASVSRSVHATDPSLSPHNQIIIAVVRLSEDSSILSFPDLIRTKSYYRYL